MVDELYLEIAEELTGKNTSAGAHLLRLRDGKMVLFMKYHTTPLWKYNAHGIRLDLLQWARAQGVTEIHFENLLTRKFYSTSLEKVFTEGIKDNLGGKGVRYYLPLDKWRQTTRRYETPWINRVERLEPQPDQTRKKDVAPAQGNLF